LPLFILYKVARERTGVASAFGLTAWHFSLWYSVSVLLWRLS